MFCAKYDIAIRQMVIKMLLISLILLICFNPSLTIWIISSISFAEKKAWIVGTADIMIDDMIKIIVSIFDILNISLYTQIVFDTNFLSFPMVKLFSVFLFFINF